MTPFSTMVSVLVLEILAVAFTVVLEEDTTLMVGDFTIPTTLPMPMVFMTLIFMEVTFPTTRIVDSIASIIEILIV